ncbi:Asp-tRNA(Asn)/Glu-tRNA(Gln) amidotransferase GatCAB subunit C [Georgenia yuyongxinii]|uniref:Asp-tRNA(Asn)/Glu-tRNA(Gln) amidotransferase GatCAB subunit C n=1 Tax=Georgenia yuyongxinii TaxID=2589797 RepID=A0A5B8C2F2_9MICO|nr:molybdopterin-dependent oxidoreductase [Georgenia yuyongxinii]QDC23385.1 Asp-tRNA(Asn)/Glu-tRNA(Gln) amidotransferase GatCAB subunit C [Georgenia yuyongxinii]
MSTQHLRTATHFGSYEVRGSGDAVTLTPVGEDASPNRLGDGLIDAHRGPLRITRPMVRRAWLERGPGPAGGARGTEPFVAVDWDTAYDLVARELARVRVEHGDAAVYGGSYGWGSAGRFHHPQSQIHRFLRMGGGYTDSVNSYSAGAMEVILPHVIGGDSWAFAERGVQWPEIAGDGELVVSFGGLAPKNAFANAGGVGRHMQPEWQRRCKDAGVAFVSISPLRTDAADFLGAEWIAPRPGTDVALMLGLAHELVRTGRHDVDFLTRCCVGWDRFERYLGGAVDGVAKDARWAGAICGVDAGVLTALAARIATRRTTINVSWSLQRMRHGEQVHWMAIVLSAMSGSLGRPGGGYAGGLGISQMGVRPRRHQVASLPQGPNKVTESIPVARISDMLLSPGQTYDFNGERRTYPHVRLVYWAGGNPFHHQQDLNRLVRAWQRPDTVVSHESWWNPLARFSDVVLPVATPLEREDFAVGMMDLTVTAMHRVLDPPPGVPTDHEAFAALADRLGYGQEFTKGRSAAQWVRHLYARTRDGLAAEGVALPDFETFWSAGVASTPEPAPVPDRSFALLRADPRAHPFETPSGRIEIFSATVASFGYDDCPGHPVWLEPEEWLGAVAARGPGLHLVSNQPRTRLHSQLNHAAHSRAAEVRDREPVLIHPDDARARGITDGQVVRLFNGRGACLAGARLTTDVRPGVVVLSTGAWFDPEDPGVPGSLERHGNPNVLTSDRATSRLAQGPSPGSTLVELEPWTGPVPTVGCFTPPEILPTTP